MPCSEKPPARLRITGGRLVLPDRELSGFDLLVRGARIEGVEPARRAGRAGRAGRGERLIDARGAWVLPGFIDVHTDYIEHMAAPRPTAVMDFTMALREAERELVTHGITTMFHSLSFFAFSEFGIGPMRDPANTRSFVSLIEQAHRSEHLIRHRFHARFEIDSLDRREEVEGYLRQGKVHLVSFMDHTPGQGQYRDMEVYRATLKAWKGLDDAGVDRSIAASRSRPKLTLEAIAEMSALARSCGVAVASHDDDTTEKISLVRGLGAGISEFPTSLAVARAARAGGMHVVCGAPNVLLGGSHSGNLSAEEAVREGAADVLCSDYYPPSLLHAVFRLARTTGRPLHEIVPLVTLNAARAVLVDGELGSIQPGKRADLLVVRELDGGLPVVSDVLVDGEQVMSICYREGAR